MLTGKLVRQGLFARRPFGIGLAFGLGRGLAFGLFRGLLLGFGLGLLLGCRLGLALGCVLGLTPVFFDLALLFQLGQALLLRLLLLSQGFFLFLEFGEALFVLLGLLARQFALPGLVRLLGLALLFQLGQAVFLFLAALLQLGQFLFGLLPRRFGGGLLLLLLGLQFIDLGSELALIHHARLHHLDIADHGFRRLAPVHPDHQEGHDQHVHEHGQ